MKIKKIDKKLIKANKCKFKNKGICKITNVSCEEITPCSSD